MNDHRIESILAWARATGGSSVGLLSAGKHALELGRRDDYVMLKQAADVLFAEEMEHTVTLGRKLIEDRKKQQGLLQ